MDARTGDNERYDAARLFDQLAAARVRDTGRGAEVKMVKMALLQDEMA